MNKDSTHYFSYLLRLWLTESQGQPVWRASLEEPGTGERHGFTRVQDLVDFIWSQTGEEPPQRTA